MKLIDVYHFVASIEDDEDNPLANDGEILAYLSRRQEAGDLQKAAYVFIGDDQMPSRLREILKSYGFNDARFVIDIWDAGDESTAVG
jgi:hypothetical protein